MSALTIPPAPSPAARFKELLVQRFGWGQCKHDYRILQRRDHLAVRCVTCGHTTEGFVIAGGKGEREEKT